MAAASKCAICGWNLFPHTPTGARNRHVYHTTNNKTLLFLELVTMFSTDRRPDCSAFPKFIGIIAPAARASAACRAKLAKIEQMPKILHLIRSSLRHPTGQLHIPPGSVSGFRIKRLENKNCGRLPTSSASVT